MLLPHVIISSEYIQALPFVVRIIFINNVYDTDGDSYKVIKKHPHLFTCEWMMYTPIQQIHNYTGQLALHYVSVIHTHTEQKACSYVALFPGVLQFLIFDPPRKMRD